MGAYWLRNRKRLLFQVFLGRAGNGEYPVEMCVMCGMEVRDLWVVDGKFHVNGFDVLYRVEHLGLVVWKMRVLE